MSRYDWQIPCARLVGAGRCGVAVINNRDYNPERDDFGIVETMQNIKEEPFDTGADCMTNTLQEQYFSHPGDTTLKNDDAPENESVRGFRIITMNSHGDGTNWRDEEVRSMVHVWSDEKISNQLKECQGAGKCHISDRKRTYVTDNPSSEPEVTEKMARIQEAESFIDQHGGYQSEHLTFNSQLLQLQTRCKKSNSLFSRSNKRCRPSSGKFRKVSKDIICLPAEYPEENCTYRVPRGKEREQLAMQGLVGKILIQSSWCFDNFRTEVVSLFRKHFSCSDNEFSFNFLQCLPGNRKLIKPNVSANFKWSGIAIINLAAQGSLYIKTCHTLSAPAKNLFFNSKQYLTEADSDGEHVIVSNPSDSQEVEVNQRAAVHVVSTLCLPEIESGQFCKQKNINVHLPSVQVPGYADEPGSAVKYEALHEAPDSPVKLLTLSKEKMTVHNEVRANRIVGKSSNMTTSCILKLLQEAGIRTACVRKYNEKGLITSSCTIIPIEWLCWRIATGSYIKRHPDAKEGQRLYPPRVEMLFKDNSSNEQVCSEEQLLAAKVISAGLIIGQSEINIMSRSTVTIFEILEKAFMTEDFTLVNMKIKFGVDIERKEIVLADVMDYDSWHQTQLEDKTWLNDKQGQGRVVVLMDSIAYYVHCEKIKRACASYRIPCELRVTSAYSAPEETLAIKSQYEGDGIPTVFVTVAGISCGLASILSANTAYPVINCPYVTADWSAQDVWSTLRTPENIGFCTVLSPQAAAQFAAHILGLNNHLLWARLRSDSLNHWVSLKQADVQLRGHVTLA